MTMGNIAQYTDKLPTATPIKHLVIIYDENVSFDHYFATYPHADQPVRRAELHRRRSCIADGGSTNRGRQLSNTC